MLDVGESSGCKGGQYEDDILLGYCVARRSLPTIQRYLLHPSTDDYIPEDCNLHISCRFTSLDPSAM